MKAQLKMRWMILALTGFCTAAGAQSSDSVVIRVGKESRVIFSIKDKRDLETLKHYDFQALMNDMVKKLENRDSSTLTKPSSEYLKDTTASSTSLKSLDNWDRDNENDDEDKWARQSRRWERRSHHSFNVDIGMNNYLQNGSFPDGNELYSVKPWGSWYVALNSILRTRVSRGFFVEWGAGVSWYNFKFDNTRVFISKDDTGVIFAEDPRTVDFTKSKLTATYVNASIVPVLEFGNHRHWNTFRIGVGPYAGYRVDSYTKQVYNENGQKFKPHAHDNYYLNNIRYGLRLQLGFRDADLFFNYDMNDLFAEGKGPKLQAFSFGITL